MALKVGKKASALGFTKHIRNYKYDKITGKATRTKDSFWWQVAKYKLVSAHNPSKFEKNVYAVSFVEKGKPLVDKHTKFFQVVASNKKRAISLAKSKL